MRLAQRLVVGTVLTTLTAPVLAQCRPQRVSSPTPYDFAKFGEAVQAVGDVAVIGDRSDHLHCPGYECQSGAVHVFHLVEGAWTLDRTVYSSRISELDTFGRAISFDGVRFVASSPGEDIAATDSGAVYIFAHDGGGWREVAEVLPPDPVFLHSFGMAVALRGDTLVVGAPIRSVSGMRAGAAYIYIEDDGRWVFKQMLAAPDPMAGAEFGHAIALNSDWLMVSARLDEEKGPAAGAVYIYRRQPPGAYELHRKLTAPGDPDSPVFGDSLDLHGTTLAVGASSVDGVTAAQGGVYVFEFEGGNWVDKALLQHGDPQGADALGASVSLAGDVIVAGAFRYDDAGVFGLEGAAYAFRRRSDGSWSKATRLWPAADTLEFGRAIATDGASAIVGSPNDSTGIGFQNGAAHLFDLGCTLCRVDLDGDGALTLFDFLRFFNLFAGGDLAADFDGDGQLTLSDFLTFQNEFAAGCS
ncbi:MAG: GC-type dockerin domain-anchored protein [Phycisphaerales bacterium JB039]